MKSILFLAIMAMSIVACDTPDNTTGTTIDSDASTMSADSAGNTTPTTTDTLGRNPSDTLGRNPTDTLR